MIEPDDLEVLAEGVGLIDAVSAKSNAMLGNRHRCVTPLPDITREKSRDSGIAFTPARARAVRWRKVSGRTSALFACIV